MDRTNWLINVLDDSNRRSIKYENRLWLRQNVRKMNLTVCPEDCQVNLSQVAESYATRNAIIIQDGKKIFSATKFLMLKEALVVVEKGGEHLVFLYYPEE